MPCVEKLKADFPLDGGVPGVEELSLALPLEVDGRVPMTGVEEGGRMDLPIDVGVFLKKFGDLTIGV